MHLLTDPSLNRHNPRNKTDDVCSEYYAKASSGTSTMSRDVVEEGDIEEVAGVKWWEK